MSTGCRDREGHLLPSQLECSEIQNMHSPLSYNQCSCVPETSDPLPSQLECSEIQNMHFPLSYNQWLCVPETSDLLGASWCLLGASWFLPGASWVPPGCLLAASWDPLGASRCLQMPLRSVSEVYSMISPPCFLLHDSSSMIPPP